MRLATNNDMRRRVKLYGTPIAQSPSPLSCNAVLHGLGLTRFGYELCECSSLEGPASTFLDDIQDPETLGCAVTIPHKMAVIPYLDDLSETARAVGSVNVTYYETDKISGVQRHIGTNTDVEGTRATLLTALTGVSSPFPADMPQRFETGKAAGLIIGAGGAARACVWALHLLNLSPIFVVNRDPKETETLLRQFSQLDMRPIESVEEAEAALTSLDDRGSEVCVAVGAIPAHPPTTPEEVLVYDIARSFFEASRPQRQEAELHSHSAHSADGIVTGKACNDAGSRQRSCGHLQIPSKPVFLDMAYKPIMTPLRIMSEEAGWCSISGLDVLVELKFVGVHIWTGHTVDAALREKVRMIVRQKMGL